MKTKKQIKEKISQIRKDREHYSKLLKPQKRYFYKQMMNAEISSLQWAMGYHIGTYYYCSFCNLRHKNIQCPKCKDGNLL